MLFAVLDKMSGDYQNHLDTFKSVGYIVLNHDQVWTKVLDQLMNQMTNTAILSVMPLV